MWTFLTPHLVITAVNVAVVQPRNAAAVFSSGRIIDRLLSGYGGGRSGGGGNGGERRQPRRWISQSRSSSHWSEIQVFSKSHTGRPSRVYSIKINVCYLVEYGSLMCDMEEPLMLVVEMPEDMWCAAWLTGVSRLLRRWRDGSMPKACPPVFLRHEKP